MVKTIGERISYARERVGISQTELARRTGITQPSISALEKGLSKRSNRVVEIAGALGQTPEWIAFGTGAFDEAPAKALPPPRAETLAFKEGPVTIELRITITVDKPPARSRAQSAVADGKT